MSMFPQPKPFENFLVECSFCGRSPERDRDLLIGPQISICKDCVEIAVEMFKIGE